MIQQYKKTQQSNININQQLINLRFTFIQLLQTYPIIRIAQNLHQMQSFEQNKSIEKHSSHESQDRKKPRPSLFPLRNSAKRKSSFNQTHNIFDPHCYNTAQTNASNNLNYSDRVDHKDNKSDTSFQYRTPSIQSDYESPKSARSTPKQFVFDTPFVPFVHQSLTKVVWQSEEVIPEQRDDIERKQSQTQNVKFMQIPQQDENQKQEKNNSQNQMQQTRQVLQNEPKVYQESTFQIKQQYIPQNISPTLQSCNPLSLRVQSKEKGASINSQNQFELKVENGLQQYDKTIDQNTQYHQNMQFLSDIQHSVFVSKAPVYYQQEQQTIIKKMGLSQPQCLEIDKDNGKKGKKLSFSYIDSISIRPIVKVSKGKQTFPKILNVSKGENISIEEDKKTIQQECQIQNTKLQISNSFCDQIKSIKKKDCGFQLQYRDRLEHIKKNVQERIGFQKTYSHMDQQTVVELNQIGQQTQRPYIRSFRINQQMNISISNNFPYFEEKINRLQYFIKDLYESKQAELKNIKNRKSIDKQTNTDHISEPSLPTSHKKSNNSATKSFRNFACQYDQKDTGLRPSLKRVSIADTKVIYQIQQSNSTETFSQKQQKKESKPKSKRSSQKVKVKVQPHDSESEQQQAMFNGVEQNKKSKRKSSKTQGKKKSKK